MLVGLAEFGPLSQAALGRRLGIDRSDISLVLDRLETDLFVTRAPDPAHATASSSRSRHQAGVASAASTPTSSKPSTPASPR